MRIHSSISLSLPALFGDRERCRSRAGCGIMAGAKPLAERLSSGFSLRSDVMTKTSQRLSGREWQREGLRAKPLRRIQSP